MTTLNAPVPAVRPKLKIVGTDGNAFAILGVARKVFISNRKHFDPLNITWKDIQEEAISGDYENLLHTLSVYFDIR
jgi:hypothetical protein